MAAAESSVSATSPGPGRVAGAGALGGAIAGAGAGAIDALWSWRLLDQFLPGTGGKLALLVYLAALYALAGAVLGPLLYGGAHALLRGTRLGALLAHARREHDRVRAAEPRDALAGLALVLAGLPITAITIANTYFVVVRAMANRKHMGLVVAVSMVAVVGALAVSAVITLFAGRAVESGLRRAARGDRAARALSSPHAPVVAGAVLLAIAAAAGVIAAWDTVKLLDLRAMWIGLVALGLAWPAIQAGGRAADALARRHRLAPAAAGLATGALAFALTLAAGGGEGVRKAAFAHSGLGSPLTGALRTLADFDRDGYSRILGGGDCDDWDADVHPGATEIPDDGVDQNCVGGDATMQRTPDELAFVDPPPDVPHNLNVVLITIDTLRADHLGAYGYERPTSPRLDALAADGTLFVNAWAHAPSTRYSIPAIVTGRYPLAVRYDFSVWWPALDPAATTLAEVLRDRGLYTGAVLNYSYFDPQRRLNQGFEYYDNTNKKLHVQAGRDGPARTRGSSSQQQTDAAIEFVSRHAHERFFLWVHYYDPHFEYEKHDGFRSFGDAPVDVYDQEILFTDHHIGRLIDDLKQRGLYDRTVIVVTGDHGEGFGEHGIDLHGYHLYAPQTKVPLIARVPGTAPRQVTTPVAHIDIMPTVVNLLGGRPDPEMQGRSLLGLIAGMEPPDTDRFVFQQLSYENEHELRGAASQRCHIIYNVSPANTWELYRIDQDPREERDVIDDPGACAHARHALEQWYDASEIPPEAAGALLPAAPSLAEPLDVDFGDSVRLLAVDVSQETARAGDALELELTWEARGRLDDGWRVFVHFEAPGGGRFLGDHEPARPLSWWRAGQYIRYRHTVRVPANAKPGDYVVWLGLFRGNERMPASSTTAAKVRDDRAAVGVVRIVR